MEKSPSLDGLFRFLFNCRMMNQRLKLLGEKWVDERRSQMALYRRFDGALRDEANQIRSLLELAALDQAAGVAASEVRAFLRRAAEPWVEVVRSFDFSEQEFVHDGGLRPSDAKEFEQKFGAVTWREGHYYGARGRAIPQPALLNFNRAMLAAAVSGDRALAHALASGYRMRPTHQVNPRWESRIIVLHHLLAEDESGAREIAERMEPGYAAGEPQQRIELPLAIVRNDPALFAAGLKAINTRFAGMWKVEKYRKWLEKLPSRTVARRVPTREETLDRAGRDLLGHGWFLSLWALAMLNIARWRGIEMIFDRPKLFSEWVPLELGGS